ncbi:MAG: S8 family serine peptidase, partial [Candidatus Dormibacteria bacterium]
SQATAAASGAAALIFSQHPNATPDQVKALLNQTATHIPGGNSASGNGVLNLNDAFGALLPFATNFSLSSTGLGTIEAARGSNHVSSNGVTLSGEQDIFGKSLNSGALASAEAAIGGLLGGGPWSGGLWNGSSWSGSSWSGSSWSGSSWSGSSWSGSSWSGSSWSTNTWLGSSWSGSSWSGSSWSGSSWSGSSWSGSSWSDGSWSAARWS